MTKELLGSPPLQKVGIQDPIRVRVGVDVMTAAQCVWSERTTAKEQEFRCGRKKKSRQQWPHRSTCKVSFRIGK
eukprot:2914116-Rhodomonas_salina.1